jgi:hypothetical protein
MKVWACYQQEFEPHRAGNALVYFDELMESFK